ncbi:MAG: lysostaphin resistance A-like protein, partial [Thermoanaerobaculia bacterium]
PVARWVGAVALVAIAYDLTARALGRPLVPTVMLEAWRTADWPALFWVAMVVAAPLVEEVLFRGFFFAGLVRSRFGPTLAIVLPAVVWTLLHLQYDAFDLSFVLVLGLVLGLARWRSGSLATCFVAHGFVNLVAMLEMVAIGG